MEARRTILFADVRDSTGLTERLGDVRSRRIIGALLQRLGAATEAHRGRVIKTIGDEIMAVFPEPADAARAAVEMQRDLLLEPDGGDVRPEIGIGFHSGPVVEEEGDVFGDVVIVAARVVTHAVAGQILTTGETLASMGDAGILCRSLGEHVLKGRDAPVELCELLWRGETAQLTTLGPRLSELPGATLVLRVGDEAVRASSDGMHPLELGRSAGCDLVVPSPSASRRHATITARGGRFYLEDHSTNGTFVRQESGDELVVHRDEVLLAGSGHIRLGAAFTEPGPPDIVYEVTALD